MTKGAYSWLALVAVIFIVILLTYPRTNDSLHSEVVPEIAPAQPDPGAGSRTNTASVETGAKRAEPAPNSGNRNDLQHHLLGLPEPLRNQTLQMSLRDGGFDCSEVLRSELIGDSWHADCGGTLLYTIRIGELGRTSIEAVPVGDFEPGISYDPTLEQ